MNDIKFYADMLDKDGLWGRYAFADDYTFVEDYIYHKKKSNIQLWRGSNGDLFIFKNVVVV